MSSPAVPYVLGGTQTEQQRLTAQAEGLEAPARWMLDPIDLNPGLLPFDVGCGHIGIMNLLSERVGADGIVVGVQREPRLFDMACTEQGRRGLSNVKLVNADALKTGLDKNSSVPIPTQLLPVCISSLQCVVRYGRADGGGPGTRSWRGLVKLSRHAGPGRIAYNL